MDLQPLFPEPILEQRSLDPGYSGHASDVRLVRTWTPLSPPGWSVWVANTAPRN